MNLIAADGPCKLYQVHASGGILLSRYAPSAIAAAAELEKNIRPVFFHGQTFGADGAAGIFAITCEDDPECFEVYSFIVLPEPTMPGLRAHDDTSKLDRFLELKAAARAIEEELDALKEEIFYALVNEPDQKLSYLGCDLSVAYRTTYEYSDGVRIADQQLKAQKKYEEQAGIAAIAKQSGYVVVKASRRPMQPAA